MNDISFSPSTNDLLHADPRNIAKLQVELTSDCNLRCTYCTLSQPWYEGRHMEDSNIHKVIEFTKRHNIQSVHLNGHGESTIAPRWTEIAQEFLKSGFHLTITTPSGFLVFCFQLSKTNDDWSNLWFLLHTTYWRLVKSLTFDISLYKR